MKEVYTFPSAIGFISVETDNGAVVSVTISETGIENTGNPLAVETRRQLEEYFDGKRISFDLPLAPVGTEFQNKVWNELKHIPYGETVSYKYIAHRIGNPNASRAVGMANNKNPIPIIIPCHRVVGSNNKLVGYAYGLDMKQKLLNLEKRIINLKG